MSSLTVSFQWKKLKVKAAQPCATLCHPRDYTVHGILQARIMAWVAVPFFRGSSQPRNWTQVSTLQADSLPAEPQGKLKNTGMGSLTLLQWIFPTQESDREEAISVGQWFIILFYPSACSRLYIFYNVKAWCQKISDILIAQIHIKRILPILLVSWSHLSRDF